MENLHFAMSALAMIYIDGVWVWCKVFGSEQADELRMGSLQPSTKASAARTAVSPLLLPCFSIIDIKPERRMVCFVGGPN